MACTELILGVYWNVLSCWLNFVFSDSTVTMWTYVTWVGLTWHGKHLTLLPKCKLSKKLRLMTLVQYVTKLAIFTFAYSCDSLHPVIALRNLWGRNTRLFTTSHNCIFCLCCSLLDAFPPHPYELITGYYSTIWTTLYSKRLWLMWWPVLCT
jgi:hypothetical protein